MKKIQVMCGIGFQLISIILNHSWEAKRTERNELGQSYPVNNRRGFAAKQKRESRKSKRK